MQADISCDRGPRRVVLELAPAELLHRSKLYAMSLLTAHSSTFFLCCVRAVEVHSWEMQAVGTEIIPIHPSPRGRFAKHLHRVPSCREPPPVLGHTRQEGGC